MGGVVDEHQAQLESFISCRCGVQSRVDVDRAEEGRRSSSSYVEPIVAGASPATVPTSAPEESMEDVQEEENQEVCFSSVFSLCEKLK